MDNETYSATQAWELETKLKSNLQEALLEQMKNFENKINSKIDQRIYSLQDDLEKNINFLHQLVANKYIESMFDHHREETSFSRNDHHHTFFMNSQCHTSGAMPGESWSYVGYA